MDEQLIRDLTLQVRSQLRAGWTGLAKVTLEVGELSRLMYFAPDMVRQQALAAAAAGLCMHPDLPAEVTGAQALQPVLAQLTGLLQPPDVNLPELVSALGVLAATSPLVPRDVANGFVARALRLALRPPA